MKKGFTLIEMLTVLSVLAILSLLIVPIIGKQMNEAKNTLYEKQIESIKAGAENWGADHLDALPNENNLVTSISLKTLQDGGYVKKQLENPKTKKEFSPTIKIEIIFKNNQYTYNVIDPSNIILTDEKIEEYNQKISNLSKDYYEKEKWEELKKEIEGLPNGSAKDALLQKMEYPFIGTEKVLELTDHTRWYSISVTDYSNRSNILESLGIQRDDFDKNYVALVNADPLTSVDSEYTTLVTNKGVELNTNLYLKDTYVPDILSKKGFYIDTNTQMRCINSNDVEFLKNIYFGSADTEALKTFYNKVLYNERFSEWFYYYNNSINKIYMVKGENTTLMSLPVYSNLSLKVLFITRKENVLKVLSEDI